MRFDRKSKSGKWDQSKHCTTIQGRSIRGGGGEGPSSLPAPMGAYGYAIPERSVDLPWLYPFTCWDGMWSY